MVPSPLPSAEERLAALRDNQRAFLSSASHELRTPLTSIIGYLEMVLELSGTLDGADRGHLETALAASHRLADVIDTLVASHRIDSEGLLLHIGRVEVGALLDPLTPEFRQRCARGRLELVTDYRHGEVQAELDTEAVGWLLRELVVNAVKFTPPGGRITLRSAVEGDELGLSVADTGPGIPAGDRAHVFERFYRSPDALDRAVAGTGLGLSIGKAIVDAHGGRLTVDSEPNGGTRVTASLPIHHRR